MQHRISMKEGIDLIRKKGGLPGWTDLEIQVAISKAIDQCAFTFSKDAEGNLDGICFGKWINAGCFHVIYFTGQFSKFFSYLKEVFPQCMTITAHRGGNAVTYKVRR